MQGPEDGPQWTDSETRDEMVTQMMYVLDVDSVALHRDAFETLALVRLVGWAVCVGVWVFSERDS